MKPALEITALELVALRFWVNETAGTKDHAKAVKLLEDAKKLWRDKFKPKKCPHCGNILSADLTEVPPLTVTPAVARKLRAGKPRSTAGRAQSKPCGVCKQPIADDATSCNSCGSTDFDT